MEQVSTGSTLTVDVYPRMSWGAIFAGWLVAASLAALLYVGGLALGFSAFDANDAAATSKGIGIGTAAWLVLTWAASLFVGALYASWFDGKDDETMGTMHGVAVWGLAVVASLVLAVIGAGNIVGTSANAVGSIASAFVAASTASSSDGQVHQIMANASQVIGAQLKKGVRDAAAAPAMVAASAEAASIGHDANDFASSGRVGQRTAALRSSDPGAVAPVVAALLRGDKQSAHEILAADTSLSSAQIDTLIQAQSAQIEQFKAKAKIAADQVAKYTATVMWVAFAALLVGLMAGAFGGWLGSSRVHRVYHLRTYRRSIPVRS